MKTTEEKITEKETGDAKEKIVGNTEGRIDKEDIYDYIEHIRNISKLADDEIESIIIDAIEEDEELLEILKKFLEKSEKISELVNDKIESIENETIGEDGDKAKKKEINDILKTFEDSDYAYPLADVIGSLEDIGYERPGTIIVGAIKDKILYIDDIDEDQTIYIALTEEGGSLWESRNR